MIDNCIMYLDSVNTIKARYYKKTLRERLLFKKLK